MSAFWLFLVMAQTAPSSPSAPAEAGSAAAVSLAPEQAELLKAWFTKVGSRRPGERFGELIIRAAYLQLGREYYNPPQHAGPEVLRVELETFQCVSLVESSVAVARCVWVGEPTSDCFLKEAVSSRYRDGKMDGYASRLHYFADWMEDNAERNRVTILAEEVKAKPTTQLYSYMSQHPAHYPALEDTAVLEKIRAVEYRLSKTPHPVIDRADVALAQQHFESGDIFGLVSDKYPGMVVIHTGFIFVGKNGKRQLLHAASFQKRVLVTASDVASYVSRRPERLGLMIARPLAPK